MYKERFVKLVGAANGDVDMLSIVEDQMNNIASYVNAVYAMEVQIQTLRFRLEGDAYREAVATLDSRRHNAHEAAISGCSILNRIAGLVGAEVMYSGDLNNRYEVADFCIAVVNELFHGRNRHSISELLTNA